jgi:hypothetical protein
VFKSANTTALKVVTYNLVVNTLIVLRYLPSEEEPKFSWVLEALKCDFHRMWWSLSRKVAVAKGWHLLVTFLVTFKKGKHCTKFWFLTTKPEDNFYVYLQIFYKTLSVWFNAVSTGSLVNAVMNIWVPYASGNVLKDLRPNIFPILWVSRISHLFREYLYFWKSVSKHIWHLSL